MKNLWRLIKLFKPQALWLFVGIFLAYISAIANILLMGTAGYFITTMASAGAVGVSVNYFTMATMIRGFAILRTVGSYGQKLATHQGTFKIISRLRVWLFVKLEPLVPSETGQDRSGDIMTRMRADMDNLERFYLNFMVPVFVFSLSNILIFSFLYYYSTDLALLIETFLILAGVILPLIVYGLSKKSEVQLVEKTALMNAKLAANLQGMGELLVFDGENRNNAEFKKISKDIGKNQAYLETIKLLSENMVLLLTYSAVVCTIVVSYSLYSENLISRAEFVMLCLVVMASFETAVIMPAAFQGLGAVLKSSSRIFEIADRKPTIIDSAIEDKRHSEFSFEFKNVCFSYLHNQKEVLKNISFKLNAGEKMAIVGPTGSGKSTIVNLALKFWHPSSGDILLNGANLKNLKGDSVRGTISSLSQRPYLFDLTVRENLHLACPNAKSSQVKAVCKSAGLDEFINNLKGGYDGRVGDRGSQLSGGELKRLAFAQVLLRSPSLIILDELGEGLDYKMETEILTKIIDNLGNSALIIISHRTACLNKMDKIVRLEDGKCMYKS